MHKVKKTVKPRTAKRRLLKLAKFLERLPKKRFDFGQWVGDDWKGKKDLSCGTTACALGWATAIPSFRKAGLRLKSYGFTSYPRGGYVTLKGHDNSLSSEEAAAQVFGITENEATYLFNPDMDSQGLDDALAERLSLHDAPPSDASAKQVAKHIRRFVKAKFDFKKEV